MPETYFTLRWPDGQEERCYSPSTIIGDYLDAGVSYPLADFMARIRGGLNAASDRVAKKYGFACSSAMAQLEAIEVQAAKYEHSENQNVTCLEIT
ncbi:MAG: MSMEG_0570 family nitrogen starvation response protein [Pseudomonadota bacterium]